MLIFQFNINFFFFPFVFYFPFSIIGEAGLCKALISTKICSLLEFSTNAICHQPQEAFYWRDLQILLLTPRIDSDPHKLVYLQKLKIPIFCTGEMVWVPLLNSQGKARAHQHVSCAWILGCLMDFHIKPMYTHQRIGFSTKEPCKLISRGICAGPYSYAY